MPDRYEFDGFTLDLSEPRVTRGDEALKLTAKSIAVLAMLLERAPNVVTRAEFEAAIWPEGFVEPANLTQTIYMLRKALGACGRSIETANGRGYRYRGTVCIVESKGPPQAGRDESPPSLAGRRRVVACALATALAVGSFFGLARLPKPAGPSATRSTGPNYAFVRP